MIPKDKCTKEVKRVAENHVEVRYFIELKDGEKIYMDEYTETYGPNRIAAEKVYAQSELDNWNDTKTVDALKAQAQAKLTLVQEVETKMKEKGEQE